MAILTGLKARDKVLTVEGVGTGEGVVESVVEKLKSACAEGEGGGGDT